MTRLFRVARCVVTALVLAAANGGTLVAQPEDDPHYKPVKAVGDRAFTVTTAQGSAVARYFGTGSLDGSVSATRALINIPGLLRNSDVYEATGEKAIAAAGEGATTILITPQFLAAIDVSGHNLPAQTLRWDVQTWLDGTPALAPAPLSAFDVLDAMVARLADRSRFPALKEIVLIGHSAGGQLVQRYAVVGRAPSMLPGGPTVRFVIANPSSYVYFDLNRPTANGGFAPYDPAMCPAFNRWKYGFEHVPPYVASGANVAEATYVSRRVTLLLGTADIDPNHPVLDKSCAAEAQGAYRLIRGRNYMRYLHYRHPTGIPMHDIVEVQGVGHDAGAMITSACGIAVIFARRGGCAAGHTDS